MQKEKLAHLVNICTRHAWVVIVLAAAIAALCAFYAVRNFAINTNVNELISHDLPWRQRELAFFQAFQGNDETILAVVNADTSEEATAAASALAAKLRMDPAQFSMVDELSESPFFMRNGLLFLPPKEV